MSQYFTFERLFVDNHDFKMFSTQHLYSVVAFVLISMVTLFVCRRLSDEKRFLSNVVFSVIPHATVVIWTILRVGTNTFVVTSDLPVDICNMTALFYLPILLTTNNQFLFDAMYFTSFTGTIQAFITPHLYDGFPHITFLKFWIVHGGIILGVIFAAVVNGMRTSASFWRANLHFNIYMTGSLLLSFCVSTYVGANYTYAVSPPPTGSVLDFMGPWPVYWGTSQLVCVPLFYGLHLLSHVGEATTAPTNDKRQSKKQQ